MMRTMGLLTPLFLAFGCGSGTLQIADAPGEGSTATDGATDTDAPGVDPGPPPFLLDAWVEPAGDAIALRANLPARAVDCEALDAADAPCADIDDDGLVDAWEDLVLDRFRPALRFDEAEPLVDDPAAVLVDVGRVTPATPPGHVRVYVMIGYHYDYGRCGLTTHNGDSERIVLDLAPLGTGPGDAELVQAYTAAHEHTINDHGRVFTGAELGLLEFPEDPVTAEPRWLVYASDGKHATYGNAQLCEDADWAPCVEEDCEADAVDPADFTYLPAIHNAGEPDIPLLTDLGAIGFPGEHAWADQDFCGGLGRGGDCAAPVRDKLTDDPF